MHQFMSLLKKESLVFTTGCSAYFLIFIYLFCSIGGTFYFGDYLAAQDSSLYSLFSLQPYILAIVIPAITMKSWAEEYKSNTAEFLLTLPISLAKTVWAKFCAAFLFATLLALSLLPFVFYSSLWLKFDWLNILSAYLGLELLILMFCSFGCFVSSLSKNLIVTYVLSIFVLLLGTLTSQTGIAPVYRNFLFAEVGVFEIFYFISFTVLFLYANLLVIEYRRNMQKNSGLVLMLSLAALIVANGIICWSINIFDRKADLTSGGFYTLKQTTKQIIKQVNNPIQMNLFIAEDYFKRDKSAAHYFEQVSRFLGKYQDLSKGMIKFSFDIVPAFSEQESALINKGFYYVKNPQGSKNYFGAIISDNETKEEIITMFLPQRIKYLEEDIDRAILKIAFPELKKSIGVYFDAEQNLDDFEAATLILENEYRTALLDNTTYQIDKHAAAVILFNPKVLSPVFLYALDQYVINGGTLLVFADKNTQNQLDRINEQPITIMKILQNWGINFDEISSDEGVAAERFKNSSHELFLNSASVIEVDDKDNDFTVTKLITDNDKLLGVALKGEFKSFYKENPFAETVIAPLMKGFKSKSKVGQVALIGDADILNEKNWLQYNSPDRDIYGSIEKSGNARFFTALVDYLVGNEIYALLPQNNFAENFESISEQIKRDIFVKTEAQYQKLKSESEDLYLQVWQLVDFDEEEISKAMDLTEVGRNFQAVTERINGIEYKRSEEYNRIVGQLMLWLIIVMSLIETFAAMIAFALVTYRKNKIIKELNK